MNEADADEKTLLLRATAGEREAFGTLVRRHQSAVRKQLRRLTRGNLAWADDIAQEAFIDAWQSLAEFRADARFSSWLYRIAYNRFLMALRSHRETDSLDNDVAPADFTTSNQAIDQQALQMDMERALDRLPDAERVALIHCYFLDLSHEEAASVIGVPLGTLKSHVLRGKARLRTTLSAWEVKVA